MTQAQARIQFADWLQRTHPGIFRKAIEVASNASETLAGLGQEPEKSFWQKFTEAAAGLGTTYLTLKNQRDAMKINLERARAGQPPIDIATTAPVIRTQVDVSPELQQRLISTAGEGLNKILLWGGIALVGFMVFKRFA